MKDRPPRLPRFPLTKMAARAGGSRYTGFPSSQFNLGLLVLLSDRVSFTRFTSKRAPPREPEGWERKRGRTHGAGMETDRKLATRISRSVQHNFVVVFKGVATSLTTSECEGQYNPIIENTRFNAQHKQDAIVQLWTLPIPRNRCLQQRSCFAFLPAELTTQV